MMLKKFLTILCIIFGTVNVTFNTVFAAFDKNAGLPTILVAEVRGYGEHNLIPKYFENFRDVLASKLSEMNRFSVDTSRINVDMENPTQEDELLSTIHMDAIAHSHLYRRELANAQMIRYGDSIMGREYYQNEEKIAQRRKSEGQPYNLTPLVAEQVSKLGAKYNVDYMLFVNLVDVDVWRKHGGIFGTHTTSQEFRGKKAAVDIAFYLINTKTGKVFEGQNTEKKTSLVSNILISKYGNNFTIQEMMQSLIETQSEGIVKIVSGKAVKAVS